MSYIELTTPCIFGVESILKKEIIKLGYEIKRVEDGRITYIADELGVCRSNIWLRTAERVMINVGEFTATSFEELFDKTKDLPWERWIPQDGKFWVKKASSIKSKLFSPSDIQSIIKKAIVERLKKTYHVNWFNEDGEHYPIRVFIKKDRVSICLDTSGEALHKRGYRTFTSKAPISETLAAAIIQLSPWNKDRILVDPFCGSGTIPIEAAMIAMNMAPGLDREFTAEKWKNIIPVKSWFKAVDEANDVIDTTCELNIAGYDIDYKVLKLARENVRNAGVEDKIHFQERDMRKTSNNKKYGFIITNPPYGERLGDKETVIELYKDMKITFDKNLEDWSYFIITSFDEFERYFGKNADKKRKLYTGMMKANLYQYFGSKPPKRVNPIN
ncbi:THUMP domain-containing class I SAM-dependent RNA methyltransferase [Vallitalea guaymasensis]|uniref:Class I SAM-dependent RNA methyltransferase n=1 Tax=Vallitalea guaymasensis TaxID=1185412 RepID=A0A8J8M9J6_9FIRM|nr:class I SAM-dependent RNA methyltransferase [Vallitalea guaymasensis]QUH28620.1 class I SAM-dependent RNA methyltransferase [Vallitalea guaymasensis]